MVKGPSDKVNYFSTNFLWAAEKPKKPDIRDVFKNLQRNPATLGDITDFPSDWLEIPIRQIQIGIEKLHVSLGACRTHATAYVIATDEVE